MDIYDLTREDLAALLPAEPAYRLRQVHRWLVRGVDQPQEMTDLPIPLRERLAAAVAPPPRVLRHTTADGGLTHKVLLGDTPEDAVESVLMVHPPTADAVGRATVCVSTQAGCAMGCPFCATGQVGLRGQLTMGQVVRQVTVMQRLLAAGGIRHDGVPPHVTNVVFMGMGEPLANLDVTIAAIRWLHDPEGFNLSARAITVSTVGLVPGMRRLAALGLPVRLAVSLHAPNDRLRDDLVPVNRQHPIGDVLAACRDYHRTTSRRITFEYVLIKGVNADLEQAAELAQLVKNLEAHVNLIPMNPTPGIDWRAPSRSQQHAFAAVLRRAGIAVTVRRNRGADIDAACGQLYADYALASGRTLPAARGAAGRLTIAGSSAR